MDELPLYQHALWMTFADARLVANYLKKSRKIESEGFFWRLYLQHNHQDLWLSVMLEAGDFRLLNFFYSHGAISHDTFIDVHTQRHPTENSVETYLQKILRQWEFTVGMCDDEAQQYAKLIGEDINLAGRTQATLDFPNIMIFDVALLRCHALFGYVGLEHVDVKTDHAIVQRMLNYIFMLVEMLTWKHAHKHPHFHIAKFRVYDLFLAVSPGVDWAEYTRLFGFTVPSLVKHTDSRVVVSVVSDTFHFLRQVHKTRYFIWDVGVAAQPALDPDGEPIQGNFYAHAAHWQFPYPKAMVLDKLLGET